MIVLRREIGDVLRGVRQRQGRRLCLRPEGRHHRLHDRPGQFRRIEIQQVHQVDMTQVVAADIVIELEVAVVVAKIGSSSVTGETGAIDVPAVAEPFIRGRAMRHLEHGRVVILVAGTGNPYFTTDTCAALRATELECDAVLKATKVDGVYTKDPKKHADAVRYESLTFAEALEKRLAVMDLTALTMCQERRLPVVVFDFKKPGNIRRVIGGENVGTLLTNDDR